jgi:hypothetical protein
MIILHTIFYQIIKKQKKIISIKNLNKIENIDKKIFQRILNYKIIISAFLKNQ